MGAIRWATAWLGLGLELGLGTATPASASLPVTAPALLGDPYFEPVGDPEAVPNGVVTAIAQSRSGLIWVGSQGGLLRFDGYRFRHYRQVPNDPSSLGDESIRDLLPLADGRLWVATQGGGISIYDPQTDQFEHLRHDPKDPNSLAEDAALKLAADRDGGIWVGTATQGLDYWDPRQRRFLHYRHQASDPAGVPDPTVRSLLVDRRGDLWLGTRDGLARRRAGSERFERVASEPDDPGSLDNQYVYGLFEASDGRIWAGTQNHGGMVIDPANDSYVRLPVDPDSPGGLGHPWISNFVEPRPGEIWVFTFGAGIDVIDAATLSVSQRLRHDPAIPSSLALDWLTSPLLDRSGLLWVGSWGGGLQRHNPKAEAFTSLRHSPLRKEGLSESSVFSALAWDDGRIWLGTGGEGIDVFQPGRGWLPGLRPAPKQAAALGALPAARGVGQDLQDGYIRALARTADGSAWVGTQQSGLYRWLGEGRGFRHVPRAGGSDDERIVQLQASRNGTLLVAAQRGLAELEPASERITVLNLEQGEPFSDPVYAMTEDQVGNLWVATAVGLLVRRSGQDSLRRVRAAPGRPGALSHTTVLSLHVDGAGQLWIGTAGGIDRLTGWSGQEPQFQRLALNSARGAAGFSGNRLLSDDRGRLWTERQVIDPKTGLLHEFGRADGVDIGSTALGAAVRTSTGQLVFGGTRGLVLIDPLRFQPWDFAPALIITELLVDGARQPRKLWFSGLVMTPQQRRLEVEFSALDLSAPERNRYAYRLDGYDASWQYSDDSRRSAHYSKLWPGDYTLRVRGSNRSGAFSAQELRLSLRVMPAWWQTPLFALAGLLALLLAISFGVRQRVAGIRKRALALESLVAERTAELLQAKEHAELALDELQGTQKQLVAAEKMASLGQLVAGVAHEINTPIGIAVTAASHMQDQSREFAAKADSGKLTRADLVSWRTLVNEAGRLVLSNLQRAHELIGSFKQVAVDQSSEQRRHFDLKAFLAEVEFALQPTYKRSAHTLTVDCSEGIALDTYPGPLFQIFTNLINNSLLHAFPEGYQGNMRITARADTEAVHILYADDGLGMPPEVTTRAFDPFFTTRRGSGGSGLGLHLVYNLTTQLLGGDIELHSAPGQGTEFELRFPRQAPSEQAAKRRRKNVARAADSTAKDNG